ncbi:VOC family protein [Curtobacterium sp. 320]|uniref:VOC family protein n=1 Tax=Curtobacterium sp. 320 TaxID=2817749 RepID=UPI0037BFEDAA
MIRARFHCRTRLLTRRRHDGRDHRRRRGATIRAATVTLGHQRVELLQYIPPEPPKRAGSPARIGTAHIALTVSDLDRVLELCAIHGWRPVGTPHRMTNGARAGTRIIYLEGTHGGFLELIAPPHRTPSRQEPSAG